MTQSEALSILKTGSNVFLTGEPGSGKSHTINEYVAYLRARGIEPAITASTGIAATHIGGMTIHSWSGIGIRPKLGKDDLHAIASSRHIAKRVRCAKVLITDEVSMLPPETLSMIDAVCREIKQSSEPFGGMQVVLVGDFFQLPPIIKPQVGNDSPIMFIEERSTRFAYDSPAWERANLSVCYLTEQHRQDDGEFLALLSAIRRNAFGADHLCRLTSRTVHHDAAPNAAPKLFSHNVDVDRVNDGILAHLPGEPQVFIMSSQGPSALASALKKGCLSPETLRLKVGAAVMFTKNNPKEGFVNGTLGVVEAFDQHHTHPIVRTRSGRRIEVEPMDWVVEENGTIRARITQLPLRLAWAITVHKSQGMSLDEAVMDLRDVFEFGQGYVALSRVRRLSGLHLLGWNERAFQVHPEVLAKDAGFHAQSEQAAVRIAGRVAGEEMTAMHERFLRLCGGTILSEAHVSAPKAARDSHTAREHGNTRGERRWERTLALIRSGKTIADVATLLGRTKGTIVGHLESLRALGQLPAHDTAHLAQGFEEAIATIHDAFRALGTHQLSTIFEHFGGAYSYDMLRIARLLLNEHPVQGTTPSPGFDKIRERHPNAYLPWDKAQDEKLQELFVKGSPVAGLAQTFNRTRGAIRSRLAKLGLVDNG
jgi:ATP-dependent DNA helicase PIF1